MNEGIKSPYMIWNKNIIGERRKNIATQERKAFDVEIKRVAFVGIRHVKVNVPTIDKKKIDNKQKSIALHLVFHRKFKRIHLSKIILNVWFINGQCVIDVHVR